MNEVRAGLGIFLKEPLPGKVKTRLAPRLGPEAAADLYRAFVADTLELARRTRCAGRWLFHSGRAPSDWTTAEDFRCRPQRAGDLGQRLAAAFAEVSAPLLVIGTDSPDLPIGHLEDALAGLGSDAESDVVLGPAEDGGVWCIGLQRPIPGFFDGIPWSRAETGDALRNRTRELGLELHEPALWYDCDEGEDLLALADRLRRGRSQANMTRQWLVRHPDLNRENMP